MVRHLLSRESKKVCSSSRSLGRGDGLADILEGVKNGEVKDSKTIAAISIPRHFRRERAELKESSENEILYHSGFGREALLKAIISTFRLI